MTGDANPIGIQMNPIKSPPRPLQNAQSANTIPKKPNYSFVENPCVPEKSASTEISRAGAFFGGLSSIGLLFKGLRGFFFSTKNQDPEITTYRIGKTALQTVLPTPSKTTANEGLSKNTDKLKKIKSDSNHPYQNTTVPNRADFCTQTGIKYTLETVFTKFPSGTELKKW